MTSPHTSSATPLHLRLRSRLSTHPKLVGTAALGVAAAIATFIQIEEIAGGPFIIAGLATLVIGILVWIEWEVARKTGTLRVPSAAMILISAVSGSWAVHDAVMSPKPAVETERVIYVETTMLRDEVAIDVVAGKGTHARAHKNREEQVHSTGREQAAVHAQPNSFSAHAPVAEASVLRIHGGGAKSRIDVKRPDGTSLRLTGKFIFELEEAIAIPAVPEPTVTPEPAPTATPVATASPSPSPTPTPAPSVTAVPSPTPAPTVVPDDPEARPGPYL